MIIAVIYEDGNVAQRFEQAPALKLYEMGAGHEIVSTRVIRPEKNGHLALLKIFLEEHVQALICGNLGQNAYEMVKNMHIHIFAGVRGDADESVQNMLNRTLQETRDPQNSSAVDPDEETCGSNCSECRYHCNG